MNMNLSRMLRMGTKKANSIRISKNGRKEDVIA